MSTYLDTNNEICNLPLVLVIPQLLQWYVELVLSHFLDNKGCPKLYIKTECPKQQNTEYLIKIETFIMIQILEFPDIG
jgi:hypothetical protein